MNKKIIVLGSLALVFGLFSLSATDAYAYKGNSNLKGPNYSQERHDAIQKALSNKDYNTWVTLMDGRGRVSQVINKDNFAKFVEAHNLVLQNKMEEAQKIRRELGLGLNNGEGSKNKKSR